jgi:hypothetical protein
VLRPSPARSGRTVYPKQSAPFAAAPELRLHGSHPIPSRLPHIPIEGGFGARLLALPILKPAELVLEHADGPTEII